MKILYLKTTDEKVRDEIADKILEMIRNSMFYEDYKLKDILFRKVFRCEKEYVLCIYVYDSVPASFYISAKMKNDDDNSNLYIVESELFPEPLELPKTVNISLNWREDSINQYKIMRQNRNKIISMICEGASAEEIEKTFGIPWSEESSIIMLHGDKICPYWKPYCKA